MTNVIAPIVINDQGWADCVRHMKSPHFDSRIPSALGLHTVVIHNITLPPLQLHTGVVPHFFMGTMDSSQPELAFLAGVRVSSHFWIDRRGEITQFVSCQDRAWHAGVSSFLGYSRCNDFTIGIELEGSDYRPFEPIQYDQLIFLLKAIDMRYDLQYVVGHSDIAPGRKTDPGPYFDWSRLMAIKSEFGSPQFPFQT